MTNPRQGYECDSCGNVYTNESVEMCAYGDCVEYICPECDGKYCEDCRDIVESEGD